jgi:CDP-glycerol glycerophosphotransferase
VDDRLAAMKMNWRSPAHILWLLLSAISVLIALPFSMLPRRVGGRGRIILTGHKLNGNLWAFYQFLQGQNEFSCAFLTMDFRYYRELRSRHETVLFLGNPMHAIAVAGAGIAISDHGPGLLRPLAVAGQLKLADVWHGVPFKGYSAASFTHVHAVHEVWVTSPYVANIYATRFGFREAQVRQTGYARTDALVNDDFDRAAILKRLGIEDRYDAIVTFAPTWKQDDIDRDIFPFGLSGDEFFAGLNSLGDKRNVLFMFRAHLNDESSQICELGNIIARSYSDHVIAEETLAITDILVTDWSSIAFDFLVTRRPTIFLDVPPPFNEGFTFDASYRAGPIAGSYAELLQRIESFVDEPESFLANFGTQVESVHRDVYGETADGRSCERYLETVSALTR